MLIGRGSQEKVLNNSDVLEICQQAFQSEYWQNRRVLAIIPDHTRSGPIDLMFKTVHDLLTAQNNQIDFLIALGTHPPMSESAINKRVGISAKDRKSRYGKTNIFNHYWNDNRQLKNIGIIPADEVNEISGGLLREKVDVKINKLIFDYDTILIIGPTFPHEVVGFSGGDKYLFPGIAGREIIDLFHWLGALITNPGIIGKKDTPVREVVNKAAKMIAIDKFCLSMVVTSQGLSGLYFGESHHAWSAAADLSDKVHIIYKDRPYKQILSQSPQMYDDLWTGGKCMYKMEPVVADEGELIIYAPHITEVSVSHGNIIEEIGYHTRDYFVKQWEKYKIYPGGILAHSTHVKGIGSYENGIEKPRVNVTLATGISPEICEKINLGYRNPASIRVDEWQNREDERILYVPKAGEMLYRLKNDPFV